MARQIKELDFSGREILIGIDTHKKSWKVAIALEHSVQKVFSQEPDAEALARHLRSHYPNGNYKCVYEAGFGGFWIQESLARAGIKCRVVHAADVPTTDKEKRLKTDRRDCRKLVRCLRNGDLDFIYIPPKQLQYDRSVVRARYQMQKDLSRSKHRIVSHLQFYGISERGGQRWTKAYRAWLKQVQQDRGDKALHLLLLALEELRELELEALRQIRQLSQTSRYAEKVKLLRSVPGIGLLTAMRLLVEIGDIERFAGLDQLSSLVGLIPNSHSSGETERVGEMTKRGRKELRTALIESAWVAIGKDPELALCYERYRQRMKPQQAIVRIAKKLLNRIRRVLITQQPYEIARA